MSVKAALGLLALIVAPVCALVKFSDFCGWRLVVVFSVFISFTTYTLYRKDKQQAESGGWRTPEATLHFLEVCGGWPAAFVAQRLVRHKIAKRMYQLNFWAIIALHQWIAFDYLHDWRFTRTAMLRLTG